MAVFEGPTVAEAIATGLKQMQTTRDNVKIDVLENPKKGFLGLGKRPAKVELTAKPAPKSVAAKTPTPAKAAAGTKPARATAPTQPVTPKRPVTAKPVKKAGHQAKPKSVAKPVKSKQTSQVAKPKPAKATDNEVPTRTPAEIAARQAANEQAVRDLSAYLLEVVKQLGITAELEVDFGNRYASLNFDTPKQGLLIGKHGRTINALQDLAQVYMNHHGASHVNVVLDVDDYRERREDTLKRLAESTAREAIATGKQVFLDPMPSFERKLIHAELADNHHVTTFSEGRDPHRAVVVAIRK
ncbi:RNA-binding cell elongation regulator Jag/EloR [Lactiplantibacillus dongliensis]|uniref:RNA-binding protein KhpB n=1 Tax=Lactiplantibacillus dongliensis TaxID=2559919 RepID=A0ABW1R393_9LACO|nr:RNA-binding cell elongation regulator Jag/EloR [Lactiplantibacillus dongliensis]